MPLKPTVWVIALLILVIGLGAWVGVLLYRLHAANGGSSESGYSVVYLQNGDIYYGKLHWWPRPHIEDPWYLVRNLQNGETSIVPFRSTFSGPASNLYMNPAQIVWWAALREDSQVTQGLKSAAQINIPAGQTAG